MLFISRHVSLPYSEMVLTAMRSQGAGGQNVNKLNTAIHLRFDINASSLPWFYKQRLLALKDHRLSKDGVLVIKAQQYRTQDKNREDALERLRQIIVDAGVVQKARKPSKPSRNAKKRRTDKKVKHGQQKKMRQKPDY